MFSPQDIDDDLTTDAVPSPPRDEKEEDNEEIPVKNIHIPNIHIPPKASKKYKRKRGFECKSSAPTAAIASVINISNASNVHVGSNYHVYVNKSETEKEKNYIITETIQKLFTSSTPVNRSHLMTISEHANAETWRNTARKLGFSDGQISQFYFEYSRSNIREVIYQTLLDWMQNEADKGTIGKLAKTLWKTGQQECVEKWSNKLHPQ